MVWEGVNVNLGENLRISSNFFPFFFALRKLSLIARFRFIRKSVRLCIENLDFFLIDEKEKKKDSPRFTVEIHSVRRSQQV